MGPVRDKLLAMLVASACGLLGACSHSSGDAGAPLVKRHAAGTVGGAAATKSPGNGADLGPTDLVSAVSGSGSGPSADGWVGLKFQVGKRPVAGKPVVITLRLAANQPLDHLEARFHPDDGLDVTQGGDFDPAGQMDSGATIDHSLTVVPAHDGIFTVMATVTAGSAAETISRSFVIPIVVGTVAQAPEPAAAAAKPK